MIPSRLGMKYAVRATPHSDFLYVAYILGLLVLLVREYAKNMYLCTPTLDKYSQTFLENVIFKIFRPPRNLPKPTRKHPQSTPKHFPTHPKIHEKVTPT